MHQFNCIGNLVELNWNRSRLLTGNIQRFRFLMTITNQIATCDNTAIFIRKSVGDSKYVRT